MEKYNTIDDFIEKIVMRFDYNETTKKIIQKINQISEHNKYTIKNNILRNEYSNRIGEKSLNIVKIDTNENKIISYIEASKKGKDYNKTFIHNLEYSENGSSKKTLNYSFNKEIKYFDNGEKIDKTTTKNTYYYFKDDVLKGISTEEKNSEILLDQNDSIINKKKNYNNEITYILPTLDRVKMKNSNGQIEYFYYSKNQKENESFDKIITKEDFERLVEKSFDTFELINDELVFNAHKGKI